MPNTIHNTSENIVRASTDFWNNDAEPAINAKNLNDIEAALVKGITAYDNLADLSSIIKNQDILDALTQYFNDNSEHSHLVTNGKISSQALAEWLNNIKVNYNGSYIDSIEYKTDASNYEVLATQEWVRNNTVVGLNRYSNSLNISIADGPANEIHIHCEPSSAPTYITVDLSTSTQIMITDNSLGTNYIDFFDNDTFDFIDIDIERIADPNNGYIKVDVAGYNAKGYNYRAVKNQVISCDDINQIEVKDSSDNVITGSAIYSVPANITNLTVFTDFDNTDLDSM